jgi:3-methyl-2-oxobutanoate hydroxymethyltransferase
MIKEDIIRTKRMTVPEFQARKHKEPLVMLTCYHAFMAQIIDPYCDALLVGDSLGMVAFGFESTLSVTLDMMILHGKAVVKHAPQSLIVVDMPFGSYEESPQKAFANASRILKETGCSAVKLEGGESMAETIHFLTQRNIPVMGHIGLQPQSIQALGSFKARGHEEKVQKALEADIHAVAEAGAFSVVIEAVVEPIAAALSRCVSIPTIGIGASAACDGQVLVLEDMLGLTPKTPKFVKHYGHLASAVEEAVKTYEREVRQGEFPTSLHTYKLKTLSSA